MPKIGINGFSAFCLYDNRASMILKSASLFLELRRFHCSNNKICSGVRDFDVPELKNSDNGIPKVSQRISSLSMGGQRFF
jgi:hypothetical protein